MKLCPEKTSVQKPKILEKDVTREIRAYLNSRLIWHWKVWQGLGSVKGVADILGIYKGRPLAIEVKAPGGELNKHQEAFLKRFQEEGGIAIVARSAAILKECLEMVDHKFSSSKLPF